MMDQYLADLQDAGEADHPSATQGDDAGGPTHQSAVTSSGKVQKKPAVASSGTVQKKPARSSSSTVLKRPAAAIGDAEDDIEVNENSEEVRDRIKARKFDKLMRFDQIPAYIKEEFEKVALPYTYDSILYVVVCIDRNHFSSTCVHVCNHRCYKSSDFAVAASCRKLNI